MRSSCRRTLTAMAGFVLAVAAAGALVRAWRRERELRSEAPYAPHEEDTVVADRVRSSLGGVESRLDIPHVHVMVERGVVLLHGDVPDESTERVLVQRVREVPGVRAVASHLHVGLLPGDTRPSAGEEGRSEAARRLIDAAAHAGGGEATGEIAVRAVLDAFAGSIPTHVRRRIASHLPLDVAAWLEPSRWAPGSASVDELYADVAARDAFAAAHTPWVVAAVLRELRALVPDDVDDVSFELPPALRHLWLDVAATA